MAKVNQELIAFNRGVVSPLALARTDVKRVALSAEEQENWIPRVLGSMMLRPGSLYLGQSESNNRARFIPFIFSTSNSWDTALLELTDSLMRVWVEDTLVSRPAVSTAVINGDFAVEHTDTVTISNGTPAAVVYAGALDAFVDSDPVHFSTTGTLPAPLDTDTTYYVKSVNPATNTFNLSEYPGGPAVATTSAGSGAHTVHAPSYIPSWVDDDDTSADYTTVVTMKKASPGVVTYTGADAFVANTAVSFSTTGALPAPLVAGTTYYIKSPKTSTNKFNLSYVPGGAAINLTTAGSGTHTAIVPATSVGTESKWAEGSMLSLTGDGEGAFAARYQALTIAPGDIDIEHALRVKVERGRVSLTIGETPQGHEYIAPTELEVGTHSIAFTPISDPVYVRLASDTGYPTLVSLVDIDPPGALTLPTPWDSTEVPTALSDLRYDQSGDVVFVASARARTMRIERRGPHSWSVADFVAEQGPFKAFNLDETTTITPSALNGEITLRASKPVFKDTNVGGLFAVNSIGQAVSADLSAVETFTDPIRVSGISKPKVSSKTKKALGGTIISDSRAFAIKTSGTWVGKITLQQATDKAGPWTDITTYTTNQSRTYDDGLDNQVLYYRLGIRTGNYTSGLVTAQLAYTSGTIMGIARITGYISPTEVEAVVLKDFGAVTASPDWKEGLWSSRRGYPSCLAFHGGRLWLAGKDAILGSVSDDYSNFDEDYEGDAGPIFRTIGAGPVDEINWLSPSRNLLVGTQGSERVVRSNNLGDPVTPSNFNLIEATTYGSGAVAPVKIDGSTIFVDKSLSRIMEINYDGNTADYATSELTSVVPELCAAQVVAIGVQRRPDTRAHFVLSDGTVALLVYDRNEEVKCWVKISTRDGTGPSVVEDVVVLPGTLEDQVYYSVKRFLNGGYVRCLEKWSLEMDCVGGVDNRQADCHVRYAGGSTNVISGLEHLEGESVVCWADGKAYGPFVVSAGQVTLPDAVKSATVGLEYQARYKSTKLAYGAQGGASIGQPKRVDHLAFILANTHYQGLQYGPDFDNLDDLPLVEHGTETAADTVWGAYDRDSVEFSGTVDTDCRICLVANAPKPVTVLACVMTMTTHDKM